VDLIRNVGDIDYPHITGHIQNEKIGEVNIPFADTQTMLELKSGVGDVDQRDYLFLKGKLDYLAKQKKG
jgi:hypothetical protein